MDKISIRNAANAKSGLQDMIDYINGFINVSAATIVEVGSYVGDSTEIWAKNCSQVIAIDPWRNDYDPSDKASYDIPMAIVEAQFDELVKAYTNIIKFKMKSIDAIKEVEDGSIDIVYIDAIHQYEDVKQDINIWKGKIKTNGFIAGHDYQKKFQGTIDAVTYVLGKPDKIFADTSWAVRL